MSSRLPDIVDPIRLSDVGQALTGSIPVSQMERLLPQLYSGEGSVDVQLEFGIDGFDLLENRHSAARIQRYRS